jgi:hypothetical protein
MAGNSVTNQGLSAPFVVADSASSFYDTKINSQLCGTLGYHVEGGKGKNLPTPLVCLAKMELAITLFKRQTEKYPRKQPSEK